MFCFCVKQFPLYYLQKGTNSGLLMLLPFFLALVATLFFPIFLPHLHLLTFTPFLALACMRKSFIYVLWLSILSGLVLDLFTSEVGFGLNALAYVLTTVVLYNQKRHFFVDKPLGLSVYTTFISFVVSFFLLIFQRVSFSLGMNVTELLIMPIIDGLYAFLWFTCPLTLYHHAKKIGWRRLFKVGN